jgi:hypothetical protein
VKLSSNQILSQKEKEMTIKLMKLQESRNITRETTEPQNQSGIRNASESAAANK